MATKVAIVVPTIREDSIKWFLKDWWPHWGYETPVTHVYIIEDNPSKSFGLDAENEHWHGKLKYYSWEEIDHDLGRNAWVIPRRTDCIRSYGFLKAAQDDADVIITLDDDCYPLHTVRLEEGGGARVVSNLVNDHLEELDCCHARWVYTISPMKPRGNPYSNVGDEVSIINMGGWSGVPDLDAPTALVWSHEAFNPDFAMSRFSPVPRGQYFAMCGMNLSFQIEALPMMYFLLMGKGSPFDRFGDIWCGIIAKRIADHLGYWISAGAPTVRHDKASNAWANLEKEVPGIVVNEHFWEWIDALPFKRNTIAGCYSEVADWLMNFVAKRDEAHKAYWHSLRHAMKIWLELTL